MATDDKNRVEIEVAVRDMFSTTLRSMGKELDAMNKRAVELGVGGGAAFDKFRRSNDNLSESNKRAAGSFGLVNTAALGLARSLIGPIGLAAGFVGVAKAMSEVANSTVQLKNFSVDTGLAINRINDLQQTLRRGGFSKGEGDNIIGALGNMANNLTAFKESSKIYQDLIKAPGGAAVAERMKDIAKSGDQMGVINEFLKTFNKQTREAKIFMAEAVGVTVSGLERMADAAKNASNIKVWEVSQEEAQKYLNFWVDAEVRFQNIFTNISNHGIKSLNELTDALKASGVSTKGIADWLNSETDKTFHTLKETVEEIKAIKAWMETLPGNVRDATGVGKEESYGYGGDIGKMNKKPWIQFFNPFNKKSEGTSDSTDFSGMRRGGGSEDGIHVLVDIRDSLLRIETGNPRGGGGSGGTGTGGGFSGVGGSRGGGTDTPSGQLFRQPGGSQLPSSLGGPGGPLGPGGSGGIAAPAGTPISRSGMATVTSASGKQFQVDARFKDNFQGFIKDWEGAGGVVGSSSGSLGMRPGNASGHPIGTAMDINQIGRGIRARNSINPAPEVEDALAKKWGLVSGNQWRNNDQGHFGVESVKAARDALIRQGMKPSEADAAASNMVKGSYFTDQRTASGLDASKIPGIALPSRSGLGKMYEVTGPDGKKMMLPQIDVGPAKWTGRGIDLSGPAADAMGYGRKNFPTDKTFSYRAADDEARQRIDQASGGGDKWGKINASVEFLNVPPGVRTSAGTEGDVFKELQISKTKQGGVYRQQDPAYE